MTIITPTSTAIAIENFIYYSLFLVDLIILITTIYLIKKYFF